MVSLIRSTESFRDRSGEIYFDGGGHIYRSVNRAAAANYEILKDWSFFERATAAGFFVGGREVDVSSLKSETNDAHYLIEHPRLSFISYPYEWSFAHFLGGHFAIGPSLEYDAAFSRPFEASGFLASGRFVFYGGN